MPAKTRGEVVRLIDSGGDDETIARLLEDDIDDDDSTTRPLIGEARARRLPRARDHLDIDDTVRPERDTSVKGRSTGRARSFGTRRRSDSNDTAGDVHFVTTRDGFIVGADRVLDATGIDRGSVRYGNTPAMIAGLFSTTRPSKAKVETPRSPFAQSIAPRNPRRRHATSRSCGVRAHSRRARIASNSS